MILRFASIRLTATLAIAWSTVAVLPVKAEDDANEEIRAHIEVGRSAIEDGLYRIAKRELKKALRKAASEDSDPLLASEAVVLLARVLIETGRTDKLGKHLNENRRWLKAAAPGTAAFWKALAEYKFGNHEKSLEIMRGFDEDYPDSTYNDRVLRLAAWCHLEAGRTNDAIVAFADFDARHEESPEFFQNLLEWGQALIAVQDYQEAPRVLAKLVNRETDEGAVAVGRLWLARVYIEDDQPENAARELDRLTDSAVIDADLVAESWFALADVHESTNALTDAVAALESGLDNARRSELVIGGTRRLGLLYLSTGSISNGVTTLKQYVSEAPDDPDAGNTQLILASTLLDYEEPGAALDEFQHYLETFTNATGIALAHKGRGWSLYALERFAESATAFEKCYRFTTSEAERAECLFKAADAYFVNKHYVYARETYQRLIQDHPESSLWPRALFQLAESHARLEDYDRAESTFMALAEAYVHDDLAAEALLRSAQLQEERGRLDGAKTLYTRIMQSETNTLYHPDATVGRGRVLYRLSRFEEAIKDFNTILFQYEESEHVEEARFRMAVCKYALGMDEEAVGISKEFLAQYTNSPYAASLYFWLGRYTFNEQEYAAAETHFQQFTNAYPHDPEVENAVLWMGRSAVAQKNYRRANEYFRNLLSMNPDGSNVADARYEQGGVKFELAKYSEAILVFQEIVSKYPDYDRLPETWIRIGNCQFQLGTSDTNRYELAKQAYQVASEHPDAGMDVIMEAQYKVGRCFEKLNRIEDAIHCYYANVMIPFRKETDNGIRQSTTAGMWFRRATRNAASIRADQQEWRKAVNILERSLGVGLPDEDAIRDQINSIRSSYWWTFH